MVSKNRWRFDRKSLSGKRPRREQGQLVSENRPVVQPQLSGSVSTHQSRKHLAKQNEGLSIHISFSKGVESFTEQEHFHCASVQVTLSSYHPLRIESDNFPAVRMIRNLEV